MTATNNGKVTDAGDETERDRCAPQGAVGDRRAESKVVGGGNEEDGERRGRVGGKERSHSREAGKDATATRASVLAMEVANKVLDPTWMDLMRDSSELRKPLTDCGR